MGEGFENVAFAVPHTQPRAEGSAFWLPAPLVPMPTLQAPESDRAQQPANVLIYHWTHQNVHSFRHSCRLQWFHHYSTA